MGSFSASLNASIAKVIVKTNANCYKIAKELFRRVVEYTPSPSNPGPWATGHLVNQWYPETGGDFSEELSSATSPSGEGSLSRIDALKGTEFLQKDGKLTLTNNLSYAYRAEILGWPVEEGWRGAKPYAMVRRALQAVGAKYA